MPRDAAQVVEPFLDSAEKNVRINAVVALGALGTPDAVARLVEVACGEEGPVRDRADAELAELWGEVPDVVAQALGRCLRDPRREGAAYLLLGRLRAWGAHVDAGRAGTRMRLRRAFRARAALRTPWSARRVGPPWAAGVAALLVLAGILFVLGRALGLGENSMISAVTRLLVVAPVLAGIFALIGVRVATPFGAYPDRVAGAAAELLAALRWGFASFAAVMLAVMLEAVVDGNISKAMAGDRVSWTLFILAVVTLPAFVRAGTLAGAGLLPRARGDVVVRVLAGAFVGIAACTCILSLYAQVPAADALTPASMRGWLLLIPGAFSLAYGFAAIDAAMALPALPAKPVRAALAAVAAVVAVGFFTAPLFGGDAALQTPGVWRLTTLPQAFTVQARGVENLRVELPLGRGAGNRDLAAELLRESVRVGGWDDPPFVPVAVDSGAYTVVVSELGTRDTVRLARKFAAGDLYPLLVSGLPVVGRRWAAIRDPLLADLRQTVEVRYQLRPAPEPGPTLLTVAERYAERGLVAEAVAAVRRAERETRASADLLYLLCWQGVLTNQAEKTLDMCFEAVDRAPERADYLLGRGMARALSGKLQDARADLRAYAEADPGAPEGIAGWIQALDRGEQPFTPEVLDGLRSRSMSRIQHGDE
jgi:hypothetical protein